MTTIFLVALFKTLTTTRLGSVGIGQLIWFAKLISKAFFVSYGTFGLGLPITLTKLARTYFDWKILAVALVLSFLIYLYLFTTIPASRRSDYSLTETAWIVLVGILLFILGYSIFLTNRAAQISATGGHNRIAYASAIGVAITQVGFLLYLSSYLSANRARRIFICLMIALLCTSSFVITNIVSQSWISAFYKQEEILLNIQEEFPDLPSHSIFVLDGVCPYLGDSIVFDSTWDLAGALKIIYSNSTLKADVMRTDFTAESDGVATNLWGEKHFYSYQNLIIYNHKTHKKFYPKDQKEAKQYLEDSTFQVNTTCN